MVDTMGRHLARTEIRWRLASCTSHIRLRSQALTVLLVSELTPWLTLAGVSELTLARLPACLVTSAQHWRQKAELDMSTSAATQSHRTHPARAFWGGVWSAHSASIFAASAAAFASAFAASAAAFSCAFFSAASVLAASAAAFASAFAVAFTAFASAFAASAAAFSSFFLAAASAFAASAAAFSSAFFAAAAAFASAFAASAAAFSSFFLAAASAFAASAAAFSSAFFAAAAAFASVLAASAAAFSCAFLSAASVLAASAAAFSSAFFAAPQLEVLPLIGAWFPRGQLRSAVCSAPLCAVLLSPLHGGTQDVLEGPSHLLHASGVSQARGCGSPHVTRLTRSELNIALTAPRWTAEARARGGHTRRRGAS